MSKHIWIVIAALFMQGCGYHFKSSCTIPSVNVQIVKNDEQGKFTNQLIREIGEDGNITYDPSSSQFILAAEITSLDNQNIGYRRDRDGDGTLRKNVRATEGREKMCVKVQILDAHTKQCVYGPVTIEEDVDYDFVDDDSIDDLSFINSQGNRQTVLSFSLGQLESKACAQAAALTPLYRKIARRIVKTMVHEWIQNP